MYYLFYSKTWLKLKLNSTKTWNCVEAVNDNALFKLYYKRQILYAMEIQTQAYLAVKWQTPTKRAHVHTFSTPSSWNKERKLSLCYSLTRSWICHVIHGKVFPPWLRIDTTVLRKVRCPTVRAEVAQCKACGCQTSQHLWHKRIPGALGGSFGSFLMQLHHKTTKILNFMFCVLAVKCEL